MWPDVKLPKKKDKFQRVAFYGPMASGKTWAADYLVRNHNYRKVTFADKLKSICYELYGVQSKDGNGRILLQQISDQLKEHDKHVWIKYALLSVGNHENFYKSNVVIDDLRYIQEAKKLKDNGFILIRVDVDEATRQGRIKRLYPQTKPVAHTHPSEIEWRKIVPDYTVNSNGYETISSIEKILAGEI